MIEVKITMTNGTDFKVSNTASNIKDFFKSVLAPYGSTMTFVEILPGRIINTANIVEIREIVDEEVWSDVEEKMKELVKDADRDIEETEETGESEESSKDVE